MASQELQEKMRRYHSDDSDRSTKQIKRTESPARLDDTYRSGWCRTPQVAAPTGYVPKESAQTRSGSVPNARSETKSAGFSRSSSIGSLRSGTSSRPVLQRWQPGSQSATALGSREGGDGLAEPPSVRRSLRGALGQLRSAPTDSTKLVDLSKAPKLESLRGGGGSGGGGGPDDTTASAPSVGSLSARSVQTVSTRCEAGREGTALPQLEGYLSKRTSGKVARWQRRYWLLRGPVLSYANDATGPTKRSFDVRKAKSVSLAPSQPRELLISFGFREWRLRADSPEVARRWLLTLEASKLVAADLVVEGCEDVGSEDEQETSSTTSSVRSGVPSSPSTSLARRPGLQSVRRSTSGSDNEVMAMASTLSGLSVASGGGSGGGGGGTLPSSSSSTAGGANLSASDMETVLEGLQVPPEELNEKFGAWFSSGQDSDGRCSLTGKELRGGLERALRDCCLTLFQAGDAARSQSSATHVGPEVAAAALTGPRRLQPQAVGASVDYLLNQYLSQMQQNILRWLAESEPEADEVADIADWWLSGAKASLKVLAGERVGGRREGSQWKETAAALERCILWEWESRSCDEVTRQIETIYASGPSTQSPESLSNSRVKLVLGLAKEILQQCRHWQKKGAAADRAVSVLIAALNAALRCYRRLATEGTSSSSSSKKGHQQMAFAELLCSHKERKHLLQKVQHGIQGSLARVTSGHREHGHRSASTPAGSRPARDASRERGGGRRSAQEQQQEQKQQRQQQQQQQQQEREQQTQSARALPGSVHVLAAAAEEAEALRHFCAEALETLADSSAEVLAVFAAFTSSFEREISTRCNALAEAHFASDHHDDLRAIKCARADNSALQKAVAAATSFTDAHFRRGANLCYCWLGLSLERLLVSRWLHQFRRSPPKAASKDDINRLIAADEKVLKSFAAHFRSAEGEDVLRPIADLRTLLSAPDEERQRAAAQGLCQLLGEAHGRALVKAAQLATLH